MRYAGLPRHFSGYMHRAVLSQDVEAADVRTMRVRKDGEPSRLSEELKNAQEAVRQGADPAETSFTFCRKIRGMGYRICWDPDGTRLL